MAGGDCGSKQDTHKRMNAGGSSLVEVKVSVVFAVV